jgi:hypothetical protein
MFSEQNVSYISRIEIGRSEEMNDIDIKSNVKYDSLQGFPREFIRLERTVSLVKMDDDFMRSACRGKSCICENVYTILCFNKIRTKSDSTIEKLIEGPVKVLTKKQPESQTCIKTFSCIAFTESTEEQITYRRVTVFQAMLDIRVYSDDEETREVSLSITRLPCQQTCHLQRTVKICSRIRVSMETEDTFWVIMERKHHWKTEEWECLLPEKKYCHACCFERKAHGDVKIVIIVKVISWPKKRRPKLKWGSKRLFSKSLKENHIFPLKCR